MLLVESHPFAKASRTQIFAIFCKMIIPNKEIPRLWIEVKDDIEYNTEIFIDYGNENDRTLEDCGGCKCSACVGPVNVVVEVCHADAVWMLQESTWSHASTFTMFSMSTLKNQLPLSSCSGLV